MRAIYNAKIIKDRKIWTGMALIFNGKIEDLIPEEDLKTIETVERFDGEGLYLGPGLIDIHIHGCGGFDVMDEEEGALSKIRKAVTSTGVTSFLPTTMTMELEKIKRALERIGKAMAVEEGAEVLGAHLEGPFINKAYKGAQDASSMISPNFEAVADYKDIIKLVTFAPELDPEYVFTKCCVSHGIIPSIGHSKATYEEAIGAINAGVRHITHIFNAMSPLHHRNPGVVGAAMDSDVTCELIADNIHVHGAAQRILLKVKGIEKILLITDAMRACLLKEGVFELGGQSVVVEKGSARLEDGSLAGSILTVNKGIQNFMQNTGVSLEEAIEMATLNPAKLLGIDHRKGSLDKGKDADIILFDEDLNIKGVFVKGKAIYL